MKLSLPSSLLAASAAAVAQAQQWHQGPSTVPEPQESRGWIVQLEPSTTADSHAEFHRRASALFPSGDYAVRREFTNARYFFGAAIDAGLSGDLEAEDAVAVLSAVPGVRRVWPNRVIARPELVGGSSSSAGYRSSSGSSSNGKRAFPSAAANNDTSSPVVHITGDSDILSYLSMGGVDAVHAAPLNLTGAGVRVAVVDTGVDYRHPALGGGFGPGFKVVAGYDLVGDDYNGYNEEVPDEDPLATCLDGAHGSHTSGIIGARDPEGVGFGIVGVAPDAELSHYRVFGCTGSTMDDVMMEAFVRAAEDGANVISVSIGQTTWWEAGDLYADTFAALEEDGVGMIVSAGNSGGSGLYTASSPALSEYAIAVGSAANTKFVTTYHAETSDGQIVEYASVVPIPDQESEFLAFAITASNNMCTEEAWLNATAEVDDMEKVIVVVTNTAPCYTYQLQELTVATGINKIFLSAYAGADLSATPPGSEYSQYNVYGILPSTAETIVKGYEAQGNNYTFSFADNQVHDSPQVNAGFMDSFSSWGPTMEMSLKPQLSAPGGNILSTWPMEGGIGYGVVSGTSMSCPYTAGVYALLKQSDPSLTPAEIRHRLQSTSTPLGLASEDFPAATGKQGAGLINALAAVTATTALSTTELNLRDSAEPSTRNITIENLSDDEQTYTLTHRGASTVDTWADLYSETASDPFRFRETNTASFADVSFSSASIAVPAKSKATFSVTVTPPTAPDIDANKLPIYGGYLDIVSSSSEQNLTIPYLGVPYARSSLPILSVPDNVTYFAADPQPPAGVPRFPYLYATDTRLRNNDIATYTFPASSGNSTSPNEPALNILAMQPTEYMRVDVVPVDTPFVPTAYGYDVAAELPVNANVSSPPADVLDVSALDGFNGVASYGSIMIVVGGSDKPKEPAYQYASFKGMGWVGGSWTWATVSLDNGTVHQLPNYDYRILIRALRYGYEWDGGDGDEEGEDRWDSWLSPVVRIRVQTEEENPQLPPGNGSGKKGFSKRLW